MAYTSYTPSSSTNLTLLYGAPYAGGSRWRYVSSDTIANVGGSSYITDAYNYGMSVGDIVEQFNPTGITTGIPYVNEYVVIAVRSSTYTTALGKNSADLSPGKCITS